MLCSRCNTYNSDEAAFCKNCGASMLNQESGQKQESEIKQDEKVFSVNPVINAIKKVASSGLFLAGAICLSVYAFFQFIAAFSGNFMFKYMETMVDLTGAAEYGDANIDGVFDIMGSVFTTTSIIGLIPVILTVIGLWLIYISGRDNTDPSMKTKGLSVIKGVVIYELVALSLIQGLAIIALILCISLLGRAPEFIGGFTDISYSFNPEYFSDGAENMLGLGFGFVIAVFVMAVIIIAISLVINLILYIKALKTINTIKNSINSGALSGKISMYLIVMLFIMGGVSAISFSLTGISLSAAYILFGICLNKLREDFRNFEVQPLDNGFYQI